MGGGENIVKTKDVFILGLRLVGRHRDSVLPSLVPVVTLLAYHVRLKGIRSYF